MLPPSSTSQASFVLPPGFRFHPTDEELVVHYLRHKSLSLPLPVPIIKDLDLYKFDPWELPGKADFGEKEWYFFSPRERKYPNGDRPNRAASSGFWKATGSDKPIACSSTGIQVGVKKALVFYRGKPPKGEKTDWIMHEYRLLFHERPPPRIIAARKSQQLDDWVLCRIYKKRSSTAGVQPITDQLEVKTSYIDSQFDTQNTYIDEVIPSLSPISKQNIDGSPNLSSGAYDIINPFLDNISYQHIRSSTNQPNQYTQDYHTQHLNQQYNQDSSVSQPQTIDFQPISSSKLNEMLMHRLLNISRIRAHDSIMQETLSNLPNLTQISPSQQLDQIQFKQASINDVNNLFMYAS